MTATAASTTHAEPADRYAVRLRDISVSFKTGNAGWFTRGGETRAVSGVSLDILAGETFSIVGESGSGKSTLGRVFCGLLKPDRGSVRIAGVDGHEIHDASTHIQVVFQDPFSALNPRMTVRRLIEEPLVVHRRGDATARKQRVGRLIDMVGLSRRHLDRYPHEFSGGQRQRIAIARAIAIEPRILLADEPLSALDVSVQAQIINLLQDLKSEFGLTLILISHDLSVVSYISDRIGVMHAGHMVETGTVDEVFDGPAHPYTRTLLDAVPHPDPATRATFAVLQPERSSVASQGCLYQKRCDYASAICKSQAPALDPTDAPDHLVACHHWRTVKDLPGGQAPAEMPYAERLKKYAAQVGAARTQATHERSMT